MAEIEDFRIGCLTDEKKEKDRFLHVVPQKALIGVPPYQQSLCGRQPKVLSRGWQYNAWVHTIKERCELCFKKLEKIVLDKESGSSKL